MNQREATIEYSIRLGDDALILGHRLSEWVSNAPFLEEDIAFANVALDFVGRARFFYDYAVQLKADNTTEDDLAFLRSEREFHNLLMLELPIGDFAFSQIRQLLIDQYYNLFLPKLSQSQDPQLAAVAEKSLKESQYHLRRSQQWLLCLGNSTAESLQRCQTALDELWGYTSELFEMDELEKTLVKQRIAVDLSELEADWHHLIEKALTQANLTIPTESWSVRGGRQGYHSENLGHLLTEMQSIHRAYPGCSW